MYGNVCTISPNVDMTDEASVFVEQTLLAAMEADEVPVAQFTRAFVRCSLLPSAKIFRDAKRQLTQIGTCSAASDMRHPTLRRALEGELGHELQLIRLATIGMVLSQSEMWFRAPEAAEMMSKYLIDRTYIW